LDLASGLSRRKKECGGGGKETKRVSSIKLGESQTAQNREKKKPLKFVPPPGV